MKKEMIGHVTTKNVESTVGTFIHQVKLKRKNGLDIHTKK